MTRLRMLWEVFFSIHLSFLVLSMGARTSLPMKPFIHAEYRLNALFGIEHTDVIRGYFAIWIPTVAIAFLLWAALRLVGRFPATQLLLKVPAGMLTILGPPICWLFLYWYHQWPLDWPLLPEACVALGGSLVFLFGRRAAPLWSMFAGVVAHSAFWYFVPDADFMSPNYYGPTGPFLGASSAMVWILFVQSLRKRRPATRSLMSRCTLVRCRWGR